MRQFANQFGKLMIKHPFWVLVIGSVGLHAAFAILAPSPLPKSDPPRNEDILKNSPIPLVKLPDKLPISKSKDDNSLLKNLFIKPINTTAPNTKNNLENPLTSFDPNELEGFPPLMGSDLPLGVPPLLGNPITPPQFVKQQPLFAQIQSALGQIDNSKPIQNSSNLRSDLKGGLKDQLSETPKPSPVQNPSPENKTAASNLKNTTSVPTNKPVANNAPINRTATTQGSSGNTSDNRPTNDSGSEDSTKNNSPSADTTNTPIPVTGTQILSFLATDGRIKNIINNGRLITTQIAPEEALIPNPEQNREKGVAWIPPKVKNIAGKRGAIVYYWLVAPDGQVIYSDLTSGDREVAVDQELVNIVLDTVKGYEFKRVSESKAGMYRLVTARYSFPYTYWRLIPNKEMA